MSFMDTVKNMLGSGHHFIGAFDDIQHFIADSGGIEGLKMKFESAGLGDVFQSWVSNGKNLSITPEQIQKVMGLPAIKNIANRLGVDSKVASEKIAEILPKIIDRFTPQGTLPSESQDVTKH